MYRKLQSLHKHINLSNRDACNPYFIFFTSEMHKNRINLSMLGFWKLFLGICCKVKSNCGKKKLFWHEATNELALNISFQSPFARHLHYISIKQRNSWKRGILSLEYHVDFFLLCNPCLELSLHHDVFQFRKTVLLLVRNSYRE